MTDIRQGKHIPLERKILLGGLISELKESESLAELKRLHEEGYDPAELMKCCVEGVRRVGLRFETGEYFISALIMAGEIMRQASEYLQPYTAGNRTSKVIGRVLLGTVEGDIHDLGKNILKDQLECNGFEVIDLGVDVPPAIFVEKALELNPEFVGISCLLTNCHPALKKTVSLLKKKQPTNKYLIVIGGTALDHIVNDYIKADFWFPDTVEAVNFFREHVGIPA